MARIKLAYKSGFAGSSKPGDIVRYDGTDYVCRRATSLPPPDPEFWQPVAIRDPAFDVEGPPGRDGRDGRDGKDGRDGASGRNGTDGKGLNWRGEWTRRTAYERNDVVEHDGSSWICTAETTRSEPSETSRHWSLVAAKGEQGERGEQGIGQRGRRGADGQTIVIENGNPPVAAIFDSDTARGDVLYVADTGHVDLARADGEPQTLAVGIALADVSAGFAGTYQTTGPVSNPAWDLIPGTVYYLDGSVAGGMTSTYPTTVGHFVVILGAALSETELNLNIHWANYIAA